MADRPFGIPQPFGDCAWRTHLPEGCDGRAVLEALKSLARAVDAVVTERHALVTFASPMPRAEVERALEEALSASRRTTAPREHRVRVRYGPPDLQEVAGQTGLSTDEVIELHAGSTYTVVAVGFLPGFAYLRGLDPRLVVPRRASPRTRVAASSVAIAGPYSGVYPFSSPGGWNVIGAAVGFVAFDAESGATLALGDSGALFAGAAVIEIASLAGFATIQDGGRPGHMHQGIPPGGALVPELLARANAAVENAADEAGIEAVGRVTVVAHAPVLVSDGQAPPVRLLAGEGHTFDAPGALVHYLAVRGGVDVAPVLGGRGTLLVASLGGHEGRLLRRGDRLAIGRAAPAQTAFAPLLDPRLPIRVVPGPDADRFDPRALDVLLTSTFTVDPRSDRVGTRLAGPRLPALGEATALSSPMVRGAIQVPPSGEPIVLGPDHPTTGGYPVVATVIRAHLGSLAARPVGASVRFER